MIIERNHFRDRTKNAFIVAGNNKNDVYIFLGI